MQKLMAFFSASILMVVLFFSSVVPVWASASFNPIHNVDINQGYTSNSQYDQIQKHLIVEKLVCRYVDGQKRCWNE
ncbi:MAG: hypothetical protein P5702_23855 [Limnospira sp. PMC 1291.21]|uniref:Uncharacterized protein n=1 Tax=Limnospira fusiformis PMC 851.14 TaxID=2219512 RepID=A0ABU9ER72_LIMFS|nr:MULTISPECIES: hypothetical protein [unclassified Limnospira]MDC0837765.1 hypothetical protein [Limnoraphis robusta]MDT9287784.1 hypothetical protein [Limnospira sp. PMC 1298.21]MDT9318530.1 hypothetical protein [Limnospira sp. PMC 1306.21]UWU51208.1 hypothetical protein APLC1_6168 [Arthrospira platensis C1]MDT9180604.1 hypothetical protein [Limnospira sp. PMC 1238.20]